jgi:hypothetical protein
MIPVLWPGTPTAHAIAAVAQSVAHSVTQSALTAREWPAAELFWTIRHGVKMTGMPAWIFRIGDDDMWAVVAHLRRMPYESPAEYRAAMRAAHPVSRAPQARTPVPQADDSAMPALGLTRAARATSPPSSRPSTSARSACLGTTGTRRARNADTGGYVMKLTPEWAGQTSRDQRATVLLRQEHEILLALFRRQREAAAAPSQEREALQEEIAAVAELIDRVEREVFFPALPPKYAPLVRAFEADHAALAGSLDGMRRVAGAGSLGAWTLRVEQLAREHLVQEESLLYTPVEREHPELNRQLYRALVDARARIAAHLAASTAQPH